MSSEAMQLRAVAPRYVAEAAERGVPPGYERTEVGVIPVAWKATDLGAICSFENGDRSSNYPSPGTFVPEGLAFINAGHLVGGRIDLRGMDYITQAAFDRLGGGKVCGGDILFCLRGTLGKFGVVESTLGDGAIASSLVIVRPKSRELVREFLACYFGSDFCSRMIEKWAGGAAQPNLGAQDLARFLIPLPCISEQRAIAEALSDVDSLLGALEALIAKKRAIKQAAMQQLLTGKTRLPGFSREWVDTALGDVIVECSSGATPYRGRPEYYKGQVRWITSGELRYRSIVDTEEHISEEAVRKTNLKVHPIGTFLIAITGLEAEGTRGSCGIVGAPATTNQSCMAIYPNERLRSEFLFYYYVLRGKSLALQYCQGTKQQSYTARTVKLLPISMPVDVREQTAIANVLSGMDSEIAALEARRDKTRAIKQGMMQELLTGRIRLIEAQAA